MNPSSAETKLTPEELRALRQTWLAILRKRHPDKSFVCVLPAP